MYARDCPFVYSGSRWGCDLPLVVPHSEKVTTRRKRLFGAFSTLFGPTLAPMEISEKLRWERPSSSSKRRKNITKASYGRRIKNTSPWFDPFENPSVEIFLQIRFVFFGDFCIRESVTDQRNSRNECCLSLLSSFMLPVVRTSFHL